MQLRRSPRLKALAAAKEQEQQQPALDKGKGAAAVLAPVTWTYYTTPRQEWEVDIEYRRRIRRKWRELKA